MLVLSRRVGESLLIGDSIRVIVTEVNANGTIKLGIEAPQDTLILRKELIDQSKRAADRTPQL